MSRSRWTFEVTLIRRFTLIGLGVTIVVALVIGYFFQQRLVAQELREAADVAGRQVSSLIRPVLDAKSAKGPLPPGLYLQVDAAVRKALTQPLGIVRIKIWNSEARLVYSDLGWNLVY